MAMDDQDKMIDLRVRIVGPHGLLFDELAECDKTFRAERLRQLATLGLMLEQGRIGVALPHNLLVPGVATGVGAGTSTPPPSGDKPAEVPSGAPEVQFDLDDLAELFAGPSTMPSA